MASRYKKVRGSRGFIHPRFQPCNHGWLRAQAARYLAQAVACRRAAMVPDLPKEMVMRLLEERRLLMAFAQRHRRSAFSFLEVDAFNERPGPWSLWVG